MKFLKNLLIILVIFIVFSINNIKGENKMANFYDFSVTSAKGEEIKMVDFKGKVVLIVNTATGCGFTPQYAPIEQMYKDYHAKGLEILDIPCNQFGGQAPGTDDEIHEFCTLHYNTTFPQMKKSDVNGENQLPLYKYLKEEKQVFVLSKQLLRSGTSIGANVRESVNAQSRMDFINKLNIALKEANETEYWLELLHESNYLDDKQFESIYNDCGKIAATLTKIIKTTKSGAEK